jgi:hypothetical protein
VCQVYDNNNIVVDQEVIPLTAWQVAMLKWEDDMYDNALLDDGLIALTASDVKYFLRFYSSVSAPGAVGTSRKTG